MVFYDTTSTYVEGEGTADLLEYGYSQDRRPDQKQLIVGLATDRDGLPVSSSVFSGNTMDMTTVAGMLERVKRFKFGRCLFICDRELVSHENLKKIEEAEYEYLVGSKLHKLKVVRDKVLGVRGRFQRVDNMLEIKEVLHSGKRYIICRNQEEAAHDRKIREALVTDLEEELSACRSQKQQCAVINHSAKKRFVRRLKSGRLVLDKKKIAEESRYDGKYVLLTTDRDLDACELASQYKHLFSVERAFRSLKSGINLRPINHYKNERIKAHVSLCVLSYFVQRYAEITSKVSCETIRRHMNRISDVKILLKKGTITKRSQLTKYQQLLLNQLDIQEPPLILKG